MRVQDRLLLELLELLHSVPGEANAWLRFLEALRDGIAPEVVTLFAAQPRETRPGILVGSGLGTSSVYLGDFLRPSVHQANNAALPLGGVLELATDEPALIDTTLFREVLEPAGVLPGPGLVVVTERDGRHVQSAVLVLPTAPRWKPAEADRALLGRLAPHLVIARRLQLRLARRGCDAEALLAAFDHLVLGVVFLDERLRVSYANRSAAELLGVAPGFTDAAALAAEAPDERTRAFQRLQQPQCNGKHNALVYAHPEDGRPLQVLATPFRWSQPDGIGGSRFAHALFIGDPKQRSGDPMRILRELFGLTNAQTRLALLLVGGCSVEEAAGLLAISPSTARGALKQVFDKTETHRQADLVRLLLSVFGQVRANA